MKLGENISLYNITFDLCISHTIVKLSWIRAQCNKVLRRASSRNAYGPRYASFALVVPLHTLSHYCAIYRLFYVINYIVVPSEYNLTRVPSTAYDSQLKLRTAVTLLRRLFIRSRSYGLFCISREILTYGSAWSIIMLARAQFINALRVARNRNCAAHGRLKNRMDLWMTFLLYL